MGKPKTKICKECHKVRPLTEFEETHKGNGKFRAKCKSCRNEKRNASYVKKEPKPPKSRIKYYPSIERPSDVGRLVTRYLIGAEYLDPGTGERVFVDVRTLPGLQYKPLKPFDPSNPDRGLDAFQGLPYFRPTSIKLFDHIEHRGGGFVGCTKIVGKIEKKGIPVDSDDDIDNFILYDEPDSRPIVEVQCIPWPTENRDFYEDTPDWRLLLASDPYHYSQSLKCWQWQPKSLGKVARQRKMRGNFDASTIDGEKFS